MSEQNQNTHSMPPQLRLGELLREHRLAKNTGIPDLARTLILSAAQISAIEAGSQASFHNQTFYLRALKKYIEFMNLGTDAEAGLLFAQIEEILLSPSTKINPTEVSLLIHAGLSHSRKSFIPQFKRSHFFWISLLCVLAIGLVTAYLEGWPAKQTDQQSEIVTPAVTLETTASKAADKTTVEPKNIPPTSPSSSSTDAGTSPGKTAETPGNEIKNVTPAQEPGKSILKLTFLAPCWVQVVEQNGKRIEKVFTPQDSPLELDQSVVTSLVIGNARESRLYSGSSEIDLSKYLNAGSGVARFSQQEIMRLSAP